MIRVNWDPIAHLGAIPINSYGLGWAAAFLAGWSLVRRWASARSVQPSVVDDAIVWIMLGSLAGARLLGRPRVCHGASCISTRTATHRTRVPRHPDQYYELLGDLFIATMLLKLRGKLPEGALFLIYLVLCSRGSSNEFGWPRKGGRC